MDRILLELGIKEEVVRENFRREKVSRPTELPLSTVTREVTVGGAKKLISQNILLLSTVEVSMSQRSQFIYCDSRKFGDSHF